MARLVKTPALVLNAIPLRETSMLITFFTEQYGKVKLVSKGVRKKKTPLLAHFMVGVQQTIEFYYHPRREISILADSALLHRGNVLRSDIVQLCVMHYIVELLNAALPLYQKNDALFHLVVMTLEKLSCGRDDKILRYFEMQFLDLVGMCPQLEHCVVCGEERTDRAYSFSPSLGGIVCGRHESFHQVYDALRISGGCLASLVWLKHASIDDLHRFSLQKGIAEELMRVLRQFMYYYIHRELRSIRVLADVCEALPSEEFCFQSR